MFSRPSLILKDQRRCLGDEVGQQAPCVSIKPWHIWRSSSITAAHRQLQDGSAGTQAHNCADAVPRARTRVMPTFWLIVCTRDLASEDACACCARAELAIVPTEMDVLIDAEQPSQPSAAIPTTEQAGAPLPAREAAMATAAATVTAATVIAASKGAAEGPLEVDIGVRVMPPSRTHEYTPQVCLIVMHRVNATRSSDTYRGVAWVQRGKHIALLCLACF